MILATGKNPRQCRNDRTNKKPAARSPGIIGANVEKVDGLGLQTVELLI